MLMTNGKNEKYFSVIKEQLEEAKGSLDKEGLPLLFLATVKKVGNYYSLV